MRCEIRGLYDEEVVKLDRLAAQRGVSREEYLRRIVRTHLIERGIKEVENKYENLVQMIMETVQSNTETIEDLISEMKGDKANDQEAFYDI